jgi:hypothetical protein
MKKITIDVTQDDIKEGEKASAEFCPIACAVRRLFPDSYIRVDDLLEVGPDDSDKDSEYYDLPESALEFIHNFDIGRHVEPFSFVAVSDD